MRSLWVRIDPVMQHLLKEVSLSGAISVNIASFEGKNETRKMDLSGSPVDKGDLVASYVSH